MVAVEIFVILSLYIYILFRVPELRIAGSVVAFAVLGGLVFYMVTVPPEPQAEQNRIAFDEIILENVELTLSPRTASLNGRAINNSSEYTLIGIVLDVTLYDCADENTPYADCFIIGEDDGYARLTVPAGQLREFSATFLFNSLPEVSGVQRWKYEITGTRALDSVQR